MTSPRFSTVRTSPQPISRKPGPEGTVAERKSPKRRRSSAETAPVETVRGPRVEVVSREPARPLTESCFLVIWWHLQKAYCGLFSTEDEAKLQAMSRNGVVIAIRGSDISIEGISDYWRRDESGNPLPAEWLTARFATI